MKTILVVDDERKIADLARDYLEHAGFAVRIAADGDSALAAIRRDRPDLVVLDLGLPGLDGLDVTRAIRRESGLPVIMLTARTDELDARVRAVLRRVDGATEPTSTEIVRAGQLTLDIPRMRADLAGRGVELTATEFALLATLAR